MSDTLNLAILSESSDMDTLEQVMLGGTMSTDLKMKFYDALIGDLFPIPADHTSSVFLSGLKTTVRTLPFDTDSSAAESNDTNVSIPLPNLFRTGLTYEVLDGVSCVHLFRLMAHRMRKFLNSMDLSEVSFEVDKTYRVIVPSERWEQGVDYMKYGKVISWVTAVPAGYTYIGKLNLSFDTFKDWLQKEDVDPEFQDDMKTVYGAKFYNDRVLAAVTTSSSSRKTGVIKTNFDVSIAKLSSAMVESLRMSSPFLEPSSSFTAVEPIVTALTAKHNLVVEGDSLKRTTTVSVDTAAERILVDFMVNRIDYLNAINGGMITSINQRALSSNFIRSIELSVGSVHNALNTISKSDDLKKYSFGFVNNIVIRRLKPDAGNGLLTVEHALIACVSDGVLFPKGDKHPFMEHSPERVDRIFTNKGHLPYQKINFGIDVSLDNISWPDGSKMRTMMAYMIENKLFYTNTLSLYSKTSLERYAKKLEILHDLKVRLYSSEGKSSVPDKYVGYECFIDLAPPVEEAEEATE